jgi:hypothetical protein
LQIFVNPGKTFDESKLLPHLEVPPTPDVSNLWTLNAQEQQHTSKQQAHQDTILACKRTQLTQLLGEYSDLPHLLPTTERDFPDNPPQTSFDWLVNYIIKDIINKPCNTPTPPEFSSKINGKAALQNLAILSKYKIDLNKALETNKNSPLGPGKEFRAQDNLCKVFSLHPLWSRIKHILTDDSKWPLVNISQDKRKQDFLNAFTLGNHKGASIKPDLVQKLISKDVKYGYSFAIPLSSIASIPGICMAPMNIITQIMINKEE